MVEFNPDGSLKLPGHLVKNNFENKKKMMTQMCIKIEREVISFAAPKKCVLRLTLSDAINDNRFIDTIYNYFKESATVPNSIKKVSEKKFEVRIGTDFRRCSDCNSLVNRYREFLEGNVIEKKGSCMSDVKQKNFCYEDYFD